MNCFNAVRSGLLTSKTFGVYSEVPCRVYSRLQHPCQCTRRLRFCCFALHLSQPMSWIQKNYCWHWHLKKFRRRNVEIQSFRVWKIETISQWICRIIDVYTTYICREYGTIMSPIDRTLCATAISKQPHNVSCSSSAKVYLPMKNMDWTTFERGKRIKFYFVYFIRLFQCKTSIQPTTTFRYR